MLSSDSEKMFVLQDRMEIRLRTDNSWTDGGCSLAVMTVVDRNSLRGKRTVRFGNILLVGLCPAHKLAIAVKLRMVCTGDS